MRGKPTMIIFELRKAKANKVWSFNGEANKERIMFGSWGGINDGKNVRWKTNFLEAFLPKPKK